MPGYFCKVGWLCAMAAILVLTLVWSPRDLLTKTEVIPSSRGMHLQRHISQQCHPHQHFYFLKIHKAAGTTTYSIFARFGLVRNLNVLTFLRRTSSYPDRHFDDYLPRPQNLTNGKYDIYCEHSIYDEEYLESKLQNDTVNVAIVREPMSHFGSVFLHYELAEKMKLNDYDDPMAEFLQRPLLHSEIYPRAVELTQNRVAMEFGYDGNRSGLDNYLEYIDGRFLVLILERLPESLIVLKRRLCWSTKDILHAHARKQSYEKAKPNKTLISLHKAWNPLDYVFYDFFSQRIDELISKQDDDFHGEVQLFKTYLENTNAFCDSICARMGSLHKSGAEFGSLLLAVNDFRYFAESKWDKGFNVTGIDCLLMRYNPQIFRDSQKVRLFPEYCFQRKALGERLKFNDEYCDRSLPYGLPRSIVNQSNFLTPCF